MQKTTFIKEFQSWAKKNKVLTDTSAEQYGSYLNYLKKEDYFAEDFKNIFETIENFYNKNDILYALTYCDKLFAEFIGTKKKYKDKMGDEWSNSRSAIVKLLMFLSSKGITCNYGDNLDDIRSKINKTNIHKIDGIEGLIGEIGINMFVKLAVEQSYFFDPGIVENRHKELSGLFTQKCSIPARLTTKEDEDVGDYYLEVKECNSKNKPIKAVFHAKEENIHISVDIDSDGNNNVRQTIKNQTGYTVCEGKESIFQNYVISHIWGCAFDPRYFTSLWNIVLIPAWANPLMDKIKPEEGSPASILQSTFMAICKRLYFDPLFKIEDWRDIQIEKEPSILCSKDVIGSDKCSDKVYNIKLLGKKDELSKAKVGKISVEPVEI